MNAENLLSTISFSVTVVLPSEMADWIAAVRLVVAVLRLFFAAYKALFGAPERNGFTYNDV